MKRLVLAVVAVSVLSVLGTGGFILSRQHQAIPTPPAEGCPPEASSPEPAPEPESQPSPVASPSLPPARRAVTQGTQQASDAPVEKPADAAPAARPAGSPIFNQAVDTLLSAQTSYGQKQAAWQQIRASGKFDSLISELEQRAAAAPTAAEYPATLGQACLQKADTIQDIREQGILGMKADQSFDAALNLDPDNWEARFWKAAAMSYWPPQLGKNVEVIERFLDLVRLQETLPSQPHYAQTYVWLGDQYEKQGRPDYARQTWQRGASLFPNDEQLVQKLNPPARTESAPVQASAQ